MPTSISETMPLITANSSVKLNFLIEQVTLVKPRNANLEPPAPVRMIFDLDNLLVVLILFHNDFAIQF